MDKDYVNNVRKWVLAVTDKYSKAHNYLMPLTHLIGDYSNDIFLRAARNVMFEKRVTKTNKKTFTIWMIKRHTDCPIGHDYVSWIAEKIINEEKNLREMIWLVKKWGHPHDHVNEPFFFLSGTTNDHNEFFDMYWKKFVYFIPDEEKRMELMHAIFKALEDRFQDGLRVSARSYKEKMLTKNNDKLVDIFNNIEFQLNDLKTIIDNT